MTTISNIKKQERWSTLDFLFEISYLRMGAFYTNFSTTTPDFIMFLSISAFLSYCSFSQF